MKKIILQIDEEVLRDMRREAFATALVGGSNSCCIAVCSQIAETIKKGKNFLKIKYKVRKK
jgi:hypothetical protein